MRERGSREGKCGVCRARVVEARRVVSRPRGELLLSSVSAWCEDMVAERASGSVNWARGTREGGWSRGREGIHLWRFAIS